MQRREFLLGLAAGAAGLAIRPRLGRAAALPNVLLVVSDDWGWPFYSFMRDAGIFPACEVDNFPVPRTPTLDRLVGEGICFPQAYVTSAKCQASRESIFSGRNRRDLENAEFETLPIPGRLGLPTIPVELAKYGYRTLGLGKWEVAEGGLFGSFTENGLYYRTSPGRLDSKSKIDKGNLELVDRFLGERQSDGNRWFMMFAPTLPHAPYHHPKTAQYDYSDVSPQRQYCSPRMEPTNLNLRNYFGSCTWVDEMIRRIVYEKLPTYGFDSNTLVLYTTDNGAVLEKGKGAFREAGLRTPIIAWLKNTIPPTGLNLGLVGSIDLFPTILDFAGVDQGLWPTFPDAQSFRALAEDPTPANTAGYRSVFFSNRFTDGDRAARDATYKLYTDKTGIDQRFFNLANDPFERDDLLQHPVLSTAEDDARCALRNALNTWWCGGSPMPTHCPITPETCS